MPYYNKDPKRDPSFDNHPFRGLGFRLRGLELGVQYVGSRCLRTFGFRIASRVHDFELRLLKPKTLQLLPDLNPDP